MAEAEGGVSPLPAPNSPAAEFPSVAISAGLISVSEEDAMGEIERSLDRNGSSSYFKLSSAATPTNDESNGRDQFRKSSVDCRPGQLELENEGDDDGLVAWDEEEGTGETQHDPAYAQEALEEVHASEGILFWP